MLTRSRRNSVLGLIFFFVVASATFLRGQPGAANCTECAVWNAPQAPFRVFGNTYYVGPHGLSSVLITSDRGHVLIDGDLPQSASQIVANIRSLGFRIQDVKFIVNSHVHFDHAGGIAELQRLSGAEVAASPWSAAVMSSGGVGRDDPQHGVVAGISKVARVRRLHDGETLRVGPLAVTAHFTPGHTPGGTSWTWKSCEDGRCLDMVFADSLTPVSAAGFRFTDTRAHPDAVHAFEKSFAFLDAVRCDILMTTHPDASDFWERLDAHRKGLSPDPLLDSSGCRDLAGRARVSLQKRIAAESGH